MFLTNDEKRMLDGQFGPGVQKCMHMLVQWGELFGAEKMASVSNAQLSTNFPIDAIVEMSKSADRVRTLSTTHTLYDPGYWKNTHGVAVESMAGGYVSGDEENFKLRIGLFEKLGILPTYTCAPYLIGIVPRPGDVFCMTGSSGQIIANSVFGARAGRESVATCFASAITGKTPLMELLVKEKRYAWILFRPENLDYRLLDEADFGAIGYFIGEIAGTRNAAIEDIPVGLPFKKSRMLLSPMPVSGACVMCHIIGTTPESNTVEEAFNRKEPEETHVISQREISQIYQRLNDAVRDEVDMVVLGCPHLTIVEIECLAKLLEGKKISMNVRLVVGISNTTYALAKECGFTDILEKNGAIMVNTCVSGTNPFLFSKEGIGVAATNSARAAHYMQRMSGGRTKTYYGSMQKCVQSAITGKWAG